MGKRAPEWVKALLKDLDDELCQVMWNLNREDYESPFQNTGNEFKTDVFEVRAYYWGDDEEEMERPNFKCGDVEISWYKHVGRGTYMKRAYSKDELIRAYEESLLSIWLYEWEHEDDKGNKPTMELIHGD